MRFQPIQTPLLDEHSDLVDVIAQSLPSVPEGAVIVVTSKIVALVQKERVESHSGEADERAHKLMLARSRSDWYLDAPSGNDRSSMVTITHGILGLMAGIDASNTHPGTYLPLPSRPYEAAAQLWEALRQHYQVSALGIVITDSTTRPLRWGVMGTYLSYAGFWGVIDARGDEDLFHRPLKVTTINTVEPLAAAAVFAMGESNQSTPLCLVTELTSMEFTNVALEPDDPGANTVSLSYDLYAPLLQGVEWKKGGTHGG